MSDPTPQDILAPRRRLDPVSQVDDGVEVLVDRTVPLDDAAAALAVVAAGHAKGKVLVEPRSG